MRALLALIIALMTGLCVPAAAQAPLMAEAERTLKPGDRFRECEVCPELVVLPPGSFLMGSPASEQARAENEGPQHRVMINSPFALGRFEVTVDQYAAFIQETGYPSGTSCDVWKDGTWEERPGYTWRKPGFAQAGSHPVACPSWDDAQAYVRWLSAKTGNAYRLPTETEWEYAARAGATTPFGFGHDDKDYCRYGNGADQVARKEVPGAEKWSVLSCSDGFAYTAPVGSFAPNAFGLYDTHGNVFEWVEDCWNDSYAGAPGDGSAWLAGDCSVRVQRGGAWGYLPDYLRVAVRGRQSQSYRYVNQGIRVARPLLR